MKAIENMTVLSEGNDWKLGSLLQHICCVGGNAVGIFDHVTNGVCWIRKQDFNKVVRQFELTDKLTYRIYRLETPENCMMCIDIMHF